LDSPAIAGIAGATAIAVASTHLKNACLIKTMGHLLWNSRGAWGVRHNHRGNGDAKRLGHESL
jgi:hypothetical protein